MKEKIKKVFNALCTWKGLMWMNVFFVAVYLACFIVTLHPAYAYSVVVHIGWAFLSYIGNKERERFIIVCKLKDLARAMAEDFAYDLKRYRELYGELPKEEETEKKKETRKE